MTTNLSIFLSKTWQIGWHGILWAFFLLLPYFFRPSPPNFSREIPLEAIFLSNLVSIPFFYWNIYFLIPRVLRRYGTWWYGLALIISILLLVGLRQTLQYLFLPVPVGMFLPFVFITLFLTAISTSFRLISDNLEQEKITKELENERLKSELSFLRSQISPHFIFNVLNSLVSLSRKKSELIEPVIIKLSELMRYMLYESDGDNVMLENELGYIQSYVDLQKLRFGNEVLVEFTFEVVHPGKQIEPMLLIPFVENAFKHGIGMIEKPLISIKLFSDNENLIFQVSNKTNRFFEESKDKNSGIGLANVKRRLDLLYPNIHKLDIHQNEDFFEIKLELTLKTV